ncbi:MAG TPA: hypothetical protein LFV92_07890 [Rickettsia endosymbiont of Ceroptres masudai]|nr:hypothetical protein [Rickettsia endosymbiont of Ceroptres masudai]
MSSSTTMYSTGQFLKSPRCYPCKALPAWILKVVIARRHCYVDQFHLCHPPWPLHGIQLKILKLLVFFIVFMDLVSKPRDDTQWILPVHATTPRKNDIE